VRLPFPDLLKPPVLTWLQRSGQDFGASTREKSLASHLDFLSPCLFYLEREGAIHLDEAQLRLCRQKYLSNTARWLRIEHHLAQILADLSRAGIKAALLKGADLILRLYPTPGLRSMGDVDLLVPDQDFFPAAQVILQAGYSLRHPELLDALQDQAGAQLLEITFIHPQGLALDLHRHWVSTPWFLPAFPIAMQPVFDRASRQPAYPHASAAMRDEVLSTLCALSPADTLAYLCLHQAMHGLQLLRSYLDIDLMIRSLPQLWDWQGFLSQISEWKMKNVVYHVFTYCQDFMDTPLPPNLLSQLDPGSAARRRIRLLVTGQKLLKQQKSIGQRYPTLVKLALAQDYRTILRLLWQALMDRPGGVPQDKKTSLLHHWRHLWHVVRRGD
jgi:hypothetical protein